MRATSRFVNARLLRLRWCRRRPRYGSKTAPSAMRGWRSGGVPPTPGGARADENGLVGVAPKPWRARAAEQVLVGSRPAAAAFRRAAEVALADAKPSGDNAFKIELAQRILVRALTLAAAGTPGRMPALPASPFS